MFNDMFYEELKAFVECVNSGDTSRSYVDNNLITAQMMQGLYDSAELGRRYPSDENRRDFGLFPSESA